MVQVVLVLFSIGTAVGLNGYVVTTSYFQRVSLPISQIMLLAIWFAMSDGEVTRKIVISTLVVLFLSFWVPWINPKPEEAFLVLNLGEGNSCVNLLNRVFTMR